MKKLTVKEQLKNSNGIIEDLFYNVCKTISNDKVLEFMLAKYNEDLSRFDKELLSEQNFADENPVGSTYSSAGSEARKRVKYMKKIREERVKLVKMFEDFIKLKKQVDKLW